MKYQSAFRAFVIAAAAAAATGCASGDNLTSAAIERADRAIEIAEENGAQQYASTTLAQARNKAADAQLALNGKEEERSARLAVQAEIDAELAIAETNRRRTEESLEEVNDSLADLRSEIDRSESF